MRHRTRFAPVVAALLFAVLATVSQSAAAKSCSTNTGCTGGQSCTNAVCRNRSGPAGTSCSSVGFCRKLET